MFYSEEIIEDVRSRNNIVDVIGTYVHLQKKGGNYFGLCPFHNEKSPSFSVSGQKQMYHCFGCGKGGNVITFLMDYENISFPEAVQMLADRAGITLPKQEYTPEQRKEADLRTILLAIQKEAAYYYNYLLKQEIGQLGYAYLRKRELTDETIQAFGLGYASQKPNDLYLYLKNKGYTDLQLKESGLVTFSEKGTYDKFWNRVMYPIMDVNNRVIGFGGRVMGEGEPKYLNSPETKIFDKSRNLYGLNVARRTREDYMLVCEGYMDVISMHQAGFTNAVASLGTAFTSQHGSLLKRYTKEIILCYDNDGAGQKAALRAIPILKESGLRIKVLNMAPHKDPDEFMKNLGPEEFKKRIKEAKNAFLFQMEVLRKQHDFSDPEQKSAFFNEAAKQLSTFEDEITRDSYTEAVANNFGIEYGTLKKKVALLGEQIGLVKSSSYESPKSGIQSGRKKDDGFRQAEELLLTWMGEEPALYEKIKAVIGPEDFREGINSQVASLLMNQIETNGEANLAAITTHFINDENQYQEVSRIVNATLPEMTENERKTAFKETILRVKNHSLEQQSKEATSAEEIQRIFAEKTKLKSLNISL